MERRAGLAHRRPKLMRRLRCAPVAVVLALAAYAPAQASAAVNPVLNGSVTDATTLPGATAVAVAGNYAYVTDYYAGTLAAIDISNPSVPVIAGTSAPSNNLLNAPCRVPWHDMVLLRADGIDIQPHLSQVERDTFELNLPGLMRLFSHNATARSSTFSSSRTLPGKA